MNFRPLSHKRPTELPDFLFGSAYYPEHWNAAIRESDPALFRAAGWNVIRMGEFAWDRIEPEFGRFDFRLFDKTIERFAAVGIRTIFCTPTAAPPRWITRESPEILRVDARGVVQQHGSRQHASHFSPAFRAHSRRITRALAEHYANNPHVIGWQTDNEFHCHFSEDHSPAAQQAWVAFLRERFQDDISRLNEAWGTAFWAQTYDTFEDILTPRADQPTHPNPAQLLDYSRFLSWGVTVFQREQIEILRTANPRWWITHNGCFAHIDYAGDFGRDLDFLSYDSYPFFDPDPRTRPASQAFNTDYARAFSGNVVILEQQSGAGGQSSYLLDNPEPGEMRKMALVNIARGADGLLFFRERTCRFGAEEYWCGVLDADNRPRRRYAEAARLGAELNRIGPSILGTHMAVRLAVAGGHAESQASHLALSLGLPSPRNMAEIVHRHFHTAGNAVGCIHPSDTLDGVSVYFLPHLALLDPAWIPAWASWVAAGGVLVVGARSGSRDLNNNVIADTPPGALRGLTGVTVEEFGRQNRAQLRPLTLRIGDETVATDLWYEQLQPDADVEVIATWDSRHLAGTPAITRRRHGLGWVYYVGTYFTAPLIEALAAHLSATDLLPEPLCTVAGVEVVERVSERHTVRFYFNHNETPVGVRFVGSGHDLVTDRVIDGDFELPAGEVAVIRLLTP